MLPNILRDNIGNGIDYHLTELGSSVANLDLGNERYSSRLPLGNGKENINGGDSLMNNHFRERRPLSNSISAPLNNLGPGTKITFET